MMVEFIHTLSGYLTDAVIFLRLLIESGKENITHFILSSWWRHQMEIFSVLLAISPVPGEFPAQRPVTRSFGVFFDLRLNKRLSKTTVRLVIWDAIAPIMTPP